MVSTVTLLKKFAYVNNSAIYVIVYYDLIKKSLEICNLNIHLQPYKSHSCCCPICSRRCSIYDSIGKKEAGEL